jgi:hypothetical protein
MKRTEESILEYTQKICDLYYNNVNVREAMDLMQGQNINAKFVEGIYSQLSTNADKITKERFDYYEFGVYFNLYGFNYWTGRYLYAHRSELFNRGWHEIIIFDLFNNKSM